MQVSNSLQAYNVYTPREVNLTRTHPLTPGLWQNQMNKLVGLMQDGPAGVQPTHKTDALEPVPGRHGRLLGENNFIKADQYPGLHSKRLQDGRTKYPQPLIDGAPNFRDLGEGVQGTAQPTVEGIKAVLKNNHNAPGDSGKPTIWTNLREEPVVYINGKPHNLRHLKAPFHNQAAPGRSAAEVEKMERELKKEILEEAKRNGGMFTTHEEEGSPPRVVERQVKLESVQTVREVYEDLQKEGYNVKFQRIPVTDMKKPEDQDLDELVKALKKADPESPLIFNCHAGQGRTTTAMVIASLMRRASNGTEGSLLKEGALREDIKEQGKHNPKNYRDILRAVKDSQKMLQSQAKADEVIGRYGEVIDLKQSVGEARTAAASKQTPASLERAADYLERYNTLVSFEQYAGENAPDFKVSYSTWKKKHPEIEENLQRLQVALAEQRAAASQYA